MEQPHVGLHVALRHRAAWVEQPVQTTQRVVRTLELGLQLILDVRDFPQHAIGSKSAIKSSSMKTLPVEGRAQLLNLPAFAGGDLQVLLRLLQMRRDRLESLHLAADAPGLRDAGGGRRRGRRFLARRRLLVVWRSRRTFLSGIVTFDRLRRFQRRPRRRFRTGGRRWFACHCVLSET